ncbi:MAG: hypothetical protein U1F11_07700 [Steroidobacteraceae bacterium]
MFKRIGISAAALAVASVLSIAPVLAGDQTPGLDKRQENQAERIENGAESGQLTRRETRRLVHGQKELARDEAAAKADGTVTARERARLQREANQQSRRIAKQKHDAQRRP